VRVIEPGWIDSPKLSALADAHGVSARSLELWRSRGLLPRPIRQPKGRAVWLYPPGTEQQLLRLVHWHKKARRLGLVGIALWVEGFPIELDSVRAALNDAMEDLGRELDEAGDIPTYIDQQARKIAGARGEDALPRVVKMKKDERIRACAYMLAVALDAKEEIDRRKDDIALVERMFGLRSGHGGGLAMQEPFVASFQQLRPVMALDKVRSAVAGATPEEFELVRLAAGLTATWTPLLLPEMLDEHSSSKAAPLRKLARHLFDDTPIEQYPLQIINHLLGLHDKKLPVDELRQAIAALQPAAVDLQMLTVLPPQKRASIFDQLPPGRQEQAKNELARRRKKATRPQTA
jgi:DNA-binding transcriptional MerR regulator